MPVPMAGRIPVTGSFSPADWDTIINEILPNLVWFGNSKWKNHLLHSINTYDPIAFALMWKTIANSKPDMIAQATQDICKWVDIVIEGAMVHMCDKSQEGTDITPEEWANAQDKITALKSNLNNNIKTLLNGPNLGYTNIVQGIFTQGREIETEWPGA